MSIQGIVSKPLKSINRFLAVTLIAIFVATPATHATSDSWNLNADDNWANSGSWFGGNIPGTADTATFGYTLTANHAVTVDANRAIRTISFTHTSGFKYTLSGGNILLDNTGSITETSASGTHVDTISSPIAIQGNGGTATFTASGGAAGSLMLISGGVMGASTAGNVTTLTLNGTRAANNDITTTAIGNGADGGKLAIYKDGAGTWRLTYNANSFSGDVTVNAGTLTVTAGSASPNGTLGVINVARNITVNNNGTLLITSSDSLGGTGTVPSPTLVINAGGTVKQQSSNVTTLGPITMNGGVLTCDGGQTRGAFQLNGTVTVAGSAASTINSTATGNIGGFCLNRNTGTSIFDVGDVVEGTDLTISGFLKNGLNDQNTARNLLKKGLGTMLLSAGGNSYSGTSTISAGTLLAGADSPSITFGFQSVTIATTTDLITLSGNTLVNGDRIVLTGSAVSPMAPTPLNFGTVYYVRDVSGNDFKVETSPGSGAIDITSAGSGVSVAKPGVLGSASSAIVLGDGSTAAGDAPSLLINGSYTVARDITVGSIAANGVTYNATIGGANTSSTSTFTGSITLNTTANAYTFTLQAATGGTVEFKTGTWTSNNKLIAIGTSGNTGTVKLSNALSTSGGISVNYGTLLLGASAPISASTLVTVAGGTLALGGNSDTVSGVILTSGSITDTGSAILTSGSTFDMRFGTVSAILGGSVGLTKSTSGTVTLSGVNAYSGVTTISGGTLSLGTFNAIPNNGAVTVSGGVYDLGGFANVTNGAITMSSGAISNGTLVGTSYTFPGGMVYATLAGIGSLTNSAEVTTLMSNNTFSGSTVISAGTLALGSSGTLAGTPNIGIAAGATVDVSVAGLTLTGSTPQQTLACRSTTGVASVNATGKTLTLASGALLSFQAVGGASTTIGKISVTGNLALNDNVTTINVSGSPLSVGTNRLMECTGTLTGSPNTVPTIIPALIAPFAATISTNGGHVDLIVTAGLPVPVFTGLSSASLPYGTSSVILSGTVSAPGPVYPGNGEPVIATINTHSVTGSVVDTVGNFSITYNDASLSTLAAGTYSVTYAYTGSVALASASDNSTSLTVTKLTPSFSGLSASTNVAYGTASLSLGGTVGSGSVYPASGEPVIATISSHSVTGNVSGSSGNFSITYNDASLATLAGGAYAISYSYTGNVSALNATSDSSTTVTVANATSFTNVTSGNWSGSVWLTPPGAPATSGGTNNSIIFSPSAPDNSTNDYTGAFVLNQLMVKSNQNVNLYSSGGSSLSFKPSSGDLPAITNVGTGALTINSPITLATNLTVGAASSGAITINSNITESAMSSLIKAGTNTLTLAGVNTFSGGVNILNGTVSLNNVTTPAGTGTITLGDTTGNNAATLNISAAISPTIANPIVLADNINQPTRTISSTVNNTRTFSGGVTGTGNLTLSSSGSANLKFTTSSLSHVGHITGMGNGTGVDPLTISCNVNNTGSITNAATGSGNMSISGNIGPNVTAVVQNSATSPMILSGGNTYNGSTTINAGTLFVNGTNTVASGAGTYTVSSGGTLGGSGRIDLSAVNGTVTVNAGGKLSPGTSAGVVGTNTLALGSGSLDLSAAAGTAGTLVFDLFTTNASDRINLASGTLNIGSGLLNLASFQFGGTLNPGQTTYTLIHSASLVGTLAASGLTGAVGGATNSTLSINGNDLVLTMSGFAVQPVTWKGNVSGVWDGGTTNWVVTGSSTPAYYVDTAAVTFDDTAVGNLTVSGLFPVAPASVTVSNITQAYTLTSVIAGSGGLTKEGAGTLTISGANTFTGDVNINAGTVSLNLNLAGNNNPTSSSLGNLMVARNINVNSGGTLLSTTVAFGEVGVQMSAALNVNGGTVVQNGAGGILVLNNVTLNGGTMSAQGGNASANFGLNGTVTVTGTAPSYMTATAAANIYGLSLAGTRMTTFNVGDVTSGPDLTISGVVGPGFGGSTAGLIKTGAGTMLLSATNAYTGATTISNGTLLVNGVVSNGAVKVVSGATLGGNGTIHGTVTNLAGSFLLPGGAVGTIGKLTLGSTLTLSGAYLAFDCTSAGTPGTDYDQIAVAGALAMSGSNVIQPNAPSGSIAEGTYTLMTFATSPTSTFTFPNGTTVMAFGEVTIRLNNGTTSLTMTAQFPVGSVYKIR